MTGPRLHRLRTHRLGNGLLARPDHGVLGITWGPISLLWDRGFKRAEAARDVSSVDPVPHWEPPVDPRMPYVP